MTRRRSGRCIILSRVGKYADATDCYADGPGFCCLLVDRGSGTIWPIFLFMIVGSFGWFLSDVNGLLKLAGLARADSRNH